MSSPDTSTLNRSFVAALLFIVLVRLFTLPTMPLLDRTEARAAMVSQNIVLGGDYFAMKAQQGEETIEYTAKPPLHYWVTAILYEEIGAGDLSSRLPSFLGFLITLLCVWCVGSKLFNRAVAWRATLFLGTTALCWFMMGMALVDSTLTACVTVGITFLILSMSESGMRRFLFEVGSGIGFGLGMLIKGPVAIVLPGLTWWLWCGSQRSLKPITKVRWWVIGAVFLLTCVPAFIAIERATPGFLEYFFINENFKRYLVRDYGDRFGSGHVKPYGTSWLFLLGGLVPWCFLLLTSLWRNRREIVKPSADQLGSYGNLMLWWGLAPTIFFTFARQNLGTYLLQGFPGIALYFACMADRDVTRVHGRWFDLLLAALGVSFIIFGIATGSGPVTLTISGIFLAIAVVLILDRATKFDTWIVSRSIAVAAVFVVINTASAHYMDEFWSTRLLFSKIRSQAPNVNTVIFPVEIPYSANVYGNGMDIRMQAPDGSALPALYVVRKKDADKILLPDLAEESWSFGKWKIYKKR